jgi:hypothetical protein
MKYEEILNAEGLDVSKSQLRRYKQYGLITTQLSSPGKSGGVHANLSKQSVEALTEAIKLSKKPHIRNIKETIFILFIQGFPVSLKILRGNLKRFFRSNIIRSLENIMEATQDELLFRDQWSDYIKRTNISVKIGRPSKETELKLKEDTQNNLDELRKISPMVLYFLNQSYNDNSFESLIKQLFISQDDLQWMKQEFWEQLIDRSTIEDFTQIQQVYKLIEKYVNILREHKDQLPRAKAAIGLLDATDSLKRIPLIELFILVMLHPDWRKKAINLLNDEETLSRWLVHWEGGE